MVKTHTRGTTSGDTNGDKLNLTVITRKDVPKSRHNDTPTGYGLVAIKWTPAHSHMTGLRVRAEFSKNILRVGVTTWEFSLHTGTEHKKSEKLIVTNSFIFVLKRFITHFRVSKNYWFKVFFLNILQLYKLHICFSFKVLHFKTRFSKPLT